MSEKEKTPSFRHAAIIYTPKLEEQDLQKEFEKQMEEDNLLRPYNENTIGLHLELANKYRKSDRRETAYVIYLRAFRYASLNDDSPVSKYEIALHIANLLYENEQRADIECFDAQHYYDVALEGNLSDREALAQAKINRDKCAEIVTRLAGEGYKEYFEILKAGRLSKPGEYEN